MSSVRKVGREQTRRRIIDAAVDVFAESGFYAARISAIAESAGVAEGTIYLYFKSKDDLLVCLFREKMSDILHRMVAIGASRDDPTTKLRRYVTEHLALAAEQPKLMHVLTVELRQSARFMSAYTHRSFGRYLAVLAGVIEEGQTIGKFRRDLPAATVARAIFGALDELALSWVLGASADTPLADRSATAQKLAEFFLRGLGVEG